MIDLLNQPLLRFLPFRLASLAQAMVWGQKQSLSPEMYQMFQTTGLLHLLVLSGQNITLLLGCLNIISQRFGLKFKLGLTMIVALFYVLTFRGEAPIIRASIMAILTSLTVWGSHTTPSLFILFLTSSLMLSFKPEWLGNLSFQLSFGATLGIILFYPYFMARFQFKSEWASAFWLSFSAQIFTAPLLLINFRELSLFSLPLNTLVACLIEPIMFLGVLLSLLGHLPILGQLISLPLMGCLSLLDMIVRFSYPLSRFTLLRL